MIGENDVAPSELKMEKYVGAVPYRVIRMGRCSFTVICYIFSLA
jgi:hypothetical protein